MDWHDIWFEYEEVCILVGRIAVTPDRKLVIIEPNESDSFPFARGEGQDALPSTHYKKEE